MIPDDVSSNPKVRSGLTSEGAPSSDQTTLPNWAMRIIIVNLIMVHSVVVLSGLRILAINGGFL